MSVENLAICGPVSKQLEDAIDWKVLLDSGEATPKDYEQFKAWIAGSTANAEAWSRFSERMAPLTAAMRIPMGREILEKAPAGAGLSKRAMLRATIGLTIAGGTAALCDRFVDLQDLTADDVTFVGQSKSVALADGSTLIMGPRTAIDCQVTAERRFVSLRSGEFMIKALSSADAPLVLQTGAMTASSAGGTFVLRSRSRDQTLTAVDATATVSAPGVEAIALKRSETVTFDGFRFHARPADIARETGWTEGLLIVDDRSVDYVIAGLRPYFPGVIRVDPEVGRLRVTGVFPLADPSATIQKLGRILGLEIVWTTPYWITMKPRTSAI